MREGLQLKLLGGLQINRNGEPVTGFISSKAQALLCYLAVTGRTHLRPALAALLWGDVPEADAKTSLRMALSNLRKLVEPHVIITRQTVAFDQESAYWLDVEEFSRRTQLLSSLPNEALTAEQLSTLQEAADLYRGDFLAGFHMRDALAFEEWVLGQQERLREMALRTLHMLVDFHTEQRDYAAGIAYATRLLALDPWREEAHRQLMLLLARDGRYNAALAQYDTCRRILSEELGVEPMVETTALYHRIQAARAAPPPNLPSQSTPFVGREEELAEVTRRLANPDCRLLTITGPGGIGKTRLTLQAAAAMGDDFLNGVHFVSLAAVTASEFLVSAMADSLDFSFYGGRDLKDQLLNYLADKELLLVLDNFEHLTSAAELLAELLEIAPHVNLLLTSRRRLNLQGEWVFELSGLTFPVRGPAHDSAIDELEAYGAVQLFVQRARQIKPDFSMTADDVSAIGDICRLVQGLPLGLELAATWVRALSCQEIAAEMAQDLDFLATSLRDVPERHQSLKAVFDHSWRLLSEEEREILRRLSVFRGSFGLDAARQVGEASLPSLSALVDKSLLRRNVARRYEMHELLRQYAAEKLQETLPEKAEVQYRHCRYYVEFLRQRETDLKGKRQHDALLEIAAEIENVRLAWQWAVAEDQLELIGEAVNSLGNYYEIRGQFKEGEGLFQSAIARLRQRVGTEDLVRGERVSRRNGTIAIDKGVQVDALRQKRILARLLARRGGLLDRLGLYTQAQELLTKSLTLFDQLGIRSEAAFSMYHLGYVDFILGDYATSRKLLEESLTIFRESDERWEVASTLNILGDVVIALGEYQEARQLFQESLAISKALGARATIGWAYHGLGYAERLLQNHQAAGQYHQQGLTIFEEVEAREGAAWAYHGLGDVAVELQDYAEAENCYRQSLTIFEEIGDLASQAETLNALATIVSAREAYQQARADFHRALRLAMEVEASPVALSALVGLASILVQEEAGRSDEDDSQQQALALLSFVQHHPASDKETQDRAASLLAELESQFPPHVVLTAHESERTRKLDEIVQQVLNDMSPSSLFENER